jgi:hypothetical protein
VLLYDGFAVTHLMVAGNEHTEAMKQAGGVHGACRMCRMSHREFAMAGRLGVTASIRRTAAVPAVGADTADTPPATPRAGSTDPDNPTLSACLVR